MQIVHLSTSITGGAGIAAWRLHNALCKSGYNSKIITKYGTATDNKHAVVGNTNLLKKASEKLGMLPAWKKNKEEALKNKPDGFELFSLPDASIDLSTHDWVKNADILHLHWVSDGYFNLEKLFKLNKKVVWTLHDMNPFTGGCHHADGCLQFENSCAQCPQLHVSKQPMATEALYYKLKSIQNLKNTLQIISPSKWLLQLSEKSKLFSSCTHHHFHNLIDNAYSWLPTSECRKTLGIPLDESMVLFVANDVNNKRKGIQYVIDAALKGSHSFYAIGKPDANLPGSIRQLGYLNVHQMKLWYGAANVFILPSLAENFPNTICESLLCGTPVVAFNVGGIPELINESNGKLVNEFNTDQFCNAIDSVVWLSKNVNRETIALKAKINLSDADTLQRHINLYNQML
jgi:glycosyltransferase involved in cell wall biosynthesis